MSLIGTGGQLGFGIQTLDGPETVTISAAQYDAYEAPNRHTIRLVLSRPASGDPPAAETDFRIRRSAGEPWVGTVLSVSRLSSAVIVVLEADIGGQATEYYWLAGQPVFAPPGAVVLPTAGAIASGG